MSFSAWTVASVARRVGRHTPIRETTAVAHEPMEGRPAERIPPQHRMRTSLEYAAVKGEGRAVRGQHCLVLVLARPGSPTKVGFIASRRSVGNAVQRNRARRRLREIVRRRFARLDPVGRWLVFIAFRTTLSAPHPALIADVERLLSDADALQA